MACQPKRSAMRCLQRVHRAWLAVHEAETAWSSRQRLQPAEDFVAVGVRRHRIVLRDSRVDGHDAGRESSLHVRRRRAPGLACPPPDSRQTAPCSRIGKRRRHVMQHASACRHAARRDHDRAAAAGRQLLGLLRRGDRLKPRRGERRDVVLRRLACPGSSSDTRAPCSA